MTMHDEQERAAEPTVAGPQSEAAVAPANEVYADAMPTVLSEEQRRLLVAVLDRIVPPNGALPGAGGLGVDAAIDRTLALTPKLRRLVLKELADNALDSGARNVTAGHLGGCRYFVEDDGPGIQGSPKQIARLFSLDRPLITSKLWRLPTRGALGNGLRVVAGAVAASGGSMEKRG